MKFNGLSDELQNLGPRLTGIPAVNAVSGSRRFRLSSGLPLPYAAAVNSPNHPKPNENVYPFALSNHTTCRWMHFRASTSNAIRPPGSDDP
jgi:hypothetical protein